MRLDALVTALPGARLVGDGTVEVARLDYDSRQVGDGSLFFCVPGENTDGLAFSTEAVEAGAVALVVENGREKELPRVRVPLVLVSDARAAMAPLAACFHGDPTAELKVVGITGTNGKTTTAFLVREILKSAGIQSGLLGTVRQVVGGRDQPAERTTPESIDLQSLFRQMIRCGDEACVMEVSSHALELRRVDAIRFDVAVFTNLTQDHLDFHGSMDEYFRSKCRLFAMKPRVSVVNIDDPYGTRLSRTLKNCETFSMGGNPADFNARNVKCDATGSTFSVNAWSTGLQAAFRGDIPVNGVQEVRTSLPGHFNVANALAAFVVARALNLGPREAAEGLSEAPPPPGRVEPIDEGQPFAVLVDYAHTPDSLENVLKAAQDLTDGRVIAVFGAGGDRDRSKRPKMGEAGARGADYVFITSDNPRSEDPEAIIAEIKSGIASKDCVKTVTDRRKAIAEAFAFAEPGDAVVIAGKGHERGQEFEGGRKIQFDDRDVAGEELRELLSRGRSGAPEPR